jgi:hypothetical protein
MMEDKPDPKKIKDSDLTEAESDHWRMKFESVYKCPYKYFKRDKDEPEVS